MRYVIDTILSPIYLLLSWILFGLGHIISRTLVNTFPTTWYPVYNYLMVVSGDIQNQSPFCLSSIFPWVEPVNIFLDDLREPPKGYSWIRCYWPEDVIAVYDKYGSDRIHHVRLDHDLGDDSIGCGNTVLVWIEEQVYTNKDFKAPYTIKVHSDNGSAKLKMESGVNNIYNYLNSLGRSR